MYEFSIDELKYMVLIFQILRNISFQFIVHRLGVFLYIVFGARLVIPLV